MDFDKIKEFDDLEDKYYLHYDMDAFFASIEQRDNPNLRNMPIAIGNTIVTTCSYEARKYGVRSAMPTSEAKMLCPKLKIVNSRVHYYFLQGYKIQQFIKKYFPKAKFVSCDEGFIDISSYIYYKMKKSNNLSHEDVIYSFAMNFKKVIYNKFKLTSSVGIGNNRVMAKIASEINKPNGIYIFYNKEQFMDYIIDKNLKVFPGIGKKTIEILNTLNIYTTRQLLDISKTDLISILGDNRGRGIYDLIRCKSSYMYDEEDIRNKKTSIGKEKTYYQYATGDNDILADIKEIADYLSEIIKKDKIYPKTLIVKIRYVNFKTITKSKTYDSPLNEESDICKLAYDILNVIENHNDIRLVGLTMSNFHKSKIDTLKLF